MNVTLAQLQIICSRASPSILATYIQPLNDAFQQFNINTPGRVAAFLAQCAHESCQFLYTRELASGEAYEPDTVAGKMLGNTQVGDGPKYKGVGLIQVTGRFNLGKASAMLRLDLLSDPTLGEQPENATKLAGWFWNINGLNTYADMDAFGTITHKVNGGYNGLDSRINFWLAARRAFSVA